MIYYNLITIILFLIIFILILKFRDVHFENFSDHTCLDPNNRSIDCDIIRVFNNKKINDKIIGALRQQLLDENLEFNKDTNEKLNNFINQNAVVRDNINNIISKVDKIDDDANEKSSEYILQKEIYEKNLLNYFDNNKDDNENSSYVMTNNEFTKKNTQIRNKLGEYYNALKQINPVKNSIKCENEENCDTKGIVIVKNKYNKNELNLKEVNLETPQSIKYAGSEVEQNKVYHLIANSGCVRFTNRLDIGIGNCANDDKDYYFGLNKIEDANSYNKYIRYNVNSKDIDEVEVDQYGVEYPFFIITPFRYPGTAVSYNGDKLEFKPVKNNPHQRFNLATLSNYCTY
jgi:hypothetical protein